MQNQPPPERSLHHALRAYDAVHLASALGKPVVALFGDSPVERWRPWGVQHRVLQPESHNVADVTVAAVLAAVGALNT